jgi:hypothetical protein
MKKMMLLAAVAGTALLSAESASAQSIYFGFGGPGYGPAPYQYYEPAPRYYGGGPRYQAYGGGDCYWVTRRRFNEYRGVWVVRRVRVCD